MITTMVGYNLKGLIKEARSMLFSEKHLLGCQYPFHSTLVGFSGDCVVVWGFVKLQTKFGR